MSAALSEGPIDPSVGRLRRTIPDAWRMIRPYWLSEDRWPALGLLLVVVSLTLAMVYLSVLLNRWNNDFFSALQEKNAVAFRRQLAPFIARARKAGRGPRRRPGRPASSRERSGDIRAWAKQAGIAVSERGRIPASVADQYEAAAKRS